MACFRGNREEFYGEVLLLDERKITLKKSSKAAAILHQVFSHLDLAEVKFFGLRFCDNKQQTHWLDRSKTLSQHRELAGPPYIFYFGVRFYAEDPSKLKDETTRWQFYLQLCQDVRRGRLLCPTHLRPQLFALMLQVERGDHDVAERLEDREVEAIYKSLSGVSRPQAQSLFLSLCSSLQLYGASLFNAYGENQSEYFLGPTPVGVVIYKNKVLVGKYFWQRIAKLHYKDETFELTVVGRNGSETSFYFQTSDRCDCKRLWRCCVDHHIFFRMSESKPLTYKVKHNSARSPTLAPRLKTRLSLRLKLHVSRPLSSQPANHTAESVSSQPVMTQAAPPAVQSCRSERTTNEEQVKPSAPWENSGHVGGLFNSKFPPNIKEEKQDGGRPQRRSRSLDGDRPMRKHRRRVGSRGNTSSGSESEKTASNNGRRRRTKRQWSHDDLIWQHIQKQLVEPDGLIDRQMEDIPYTEVRVSGEPIRARHFSRGRRHRRCVSASDVNLKVELLPPLPVTKATSSSHQAPTSP